MNIYMRNQDDIYDLKIIAKSYISCLWVYFLVSQTQMLKTNQNKKDNMSTLLNIENIVVSARNPADTQKKGKVADKTELKKRNRWG